MAGAAGHGRGFEEVSAMNGKNVRTSNSATGAFRFAALVFGVVLLLLPAVLWAQPGRKQVLQGNKLYEQGKYDEALVQYQDALIDDPGNLVAEFNVGNAQYKKKKYDEALKAYKKATALEDPLLRSQAYYNLGNTLYRLGKLPEAILAYKKALELNPNDEDAKYNLEYVRAKLKQQSKKQRQNQQQQQRQKQQSGQGQNQKNQQQDQKQQQQQGQQNQQQQQQGQQQKQQETQQKQNKGKQGQVKQLTKEQAERLLDALNGKEEKLLKKQRTRGGSVRRVQDW